MDFQTVLSQNKGYTQTSLYPILAIKFSMLCFSASPDTEIFFSTDGSIPDPLNLNVLSATKTYRYKNPFKLKPGTRTVQAVSVSR